MLLSWQCACHRQKRFYRSEHIMSKPTQAGKNGGNSSLQEAKGAKSSSAGNSGGAKGNSQSATAGGKASTKDSGSKQGGSAKSK
jgi:hypothetical protein